MRLLGLSCCLLLSLVCTPVLAQSDSETAQAAIVFDVRMEKVTGSPLGKSLGLKEKMASMPKQEDAPDVSKIVRIFGATTPPQDMGEVQQLQTGGLPVEFFVRIEFETAEAAQKLLTKPKEKNGGTIERNGVTYYKAPEGGDMPEGIMIYSPSDKTIEVGTEAFAFRTNAKPFTAGANNAWNKAADEAIRLAIDLDAAKTLIEQLVSEGKRGAPPMVAPYLDLLKKMKTMTLTLDLTGKNLVTLQSTAKSASDAAEIKEALDSLIGLAQLGGKEQAKQMEQQDPEGAKVFNALLDGMAASADGDDVSMMIPKPDGYDKVVSKMIERLPFMGGGF